MTISVAERAELAAAVSELLHGECTEQDVRRVIGTDDGFDRDLWRKLAAQGVTGLLVDSEYGGVGLGALELEAVAEATGAALLPAPFLSSAVLASALIEAAGTDADKQRLLPGLVEGTSVGTVAVTGARGTWAREGVAVRAAAADAPGDADYTLTGNAHYVIHGQVADVILVGGPRQRRLRRLPDQHPTPTASSARPQRFSTRPSPCRRTRSTPPRPAGSAPPDGRRCSRPSTSR